MFLIILTPLVYHFFIKVIEKNKDYLFKNIYVHKSKNIDSLILGFRKLHNYTMTGFSSAMTYYSGKEIMTQWKGENFFCEEYTPTVSLEKIAFLFFLSKYSTECIVLYAIP